MINYFLITQSKLIQNEILEFKRRKSQKLKNN